jgi:Family of unknown function (DUF6404)
MTHDQKVEEFKRILRLRGYWLSNAIPPMWRLLWKLGFKTPPPYFLPFLTGAIYAGSFFIGSLLVSRWFISWFIPKSIDLSDLVIIAVSGIFFGVSMSMTWRGASQKLHLPSWDIFPSREGENL